MFIFTEFPALSFFRDLWEKLPLRYWPSDSLRCWRRYVPMSDRIERGPDKT